MIPRVLILSYVTDIGWKICPQLVCAVALLLQLHTKQMALLLRRFLSKQARQTSTSSLNDPLNALGVSVFVFNYVLEQREKVGGGF
jgi:hypothetical protein